MEEKDTRFVAHLDILGMSTIVEKNPDDAWDLLSDLVSVRDQASNYEFEFLETNERLRVIDQIYMVTFSDTILLFTKGASATELRCMIILITEIFHKAIFRCVPIRMGLSVGVFYFNLDKSMYAGPAFIEAYRAGESAQWLGITLSEFVHKKAIGLNMKSGVSDVVVEWAIPLKTGYRNGYVINWPAIFAYDLKVVPPISVEQFYSAFENTFGQFQGLPEVVKSKYKNTVDFMNHQLEIHNAA